MLIAAEMVSRHPLHERTATGRPHVRPDPFRPPTSYLSVLCGFPDVTYLCGNRNVIAIDRYIYIILSYPYMKHAVHIVAWLLTGPKEWNRTKLELNLQRLYLQR
jgi:hypothetical protein